MTIPLPDRRIRRDKHLTHHIEPQRDCSSFHWVATEVNRWPIWRPRSRALKVWLVSDSGHQYRDAGNGGFPTFAPHNLPDRTRQQSGHHSSGWLR